MKERIKKAEADMGKIVEFVKKEMAALRASRASVTLLDGITVPAYGGRLPINQLATVTVPQSNLIVIQPWDRSLTGEISKAILSSNLGLNPVTEATGIKIPVPPLSEERRKEVVRVAHKIAEQGRIEIREVRRKYNEALKKAEKEKEISEDDMHYAIAEIQKLTDQHISEIDKLLSVKEREIME